MIISQKHFENIQKTIQSLPDRLNFKIGEVSSFLSVPSYSLRYWEKEFSPLKPQKFINNQRLYTRRDISTLLLIKILLNEEKFSVDGLRQHLSRYLKQMQAYFNKDKIKKRDSHSQMEKAPSLSLNKLDHAKLDHSKIDRSKTDQAKLNHAKKESSHHPELKEKAQQLLSALSKMKEDMKQASL